MWSKEENDQLKENILEYCKVGMFCVFWDQ